MMPRDDAPQPVMRWRDHPIVSAGLGILAVVAITLTCAILP